MAVADDKRERKRVVVIGNGISAVSALTALKGRQKAEVVAIFAHEFLEWNLSATYFFANPSTYDQFVSRDKTLFEVPGVTYVYDVVEAVEPSTKTLKLRGAGPMAYDALIVASGYKLPLIQRGLGQTYAQRKAEVQEWGAAIAAAKTVVVSGPGAIGLEYAADIKLAHPKTRVVLLSRSGTLMNDAYPDRLKQKFAEVLKKQNIELLKGSGGTEPTKEPASLTLDDGTTLEYDVFIPAFGQGVQTAFLPSSLLDKKGAVVTNQFLQSTSAPEIFAVGVNSTGQGFSAPKLDQQAKDAGKNAVKVALEGPSAALAPHKENQPSKDWGNRPMTVKIGYGPGGYIFWDAEQFDPAFTTITCKGQGGFPLWPCVCCWCCAGSCSHACGTCGSECEGEPAARFYQNFFGTGGVGLFTKMFGLKGFGKAPAGGGPVKAEAPMERA